MPRKDLSRFQAGSLELQLGDRTYLVRPPSAARGKLLAKVLSVGVKAAQTMNSEQEITEDEIREELGDELTDSDEPLERIWALALGEDVLAQLHEDLPLSDIAMAGQYAAYYWVFGEKAATELIEAAQRDEDGTRSVPESEAEVPFPKPSRSGRSTASATRSRTARTGGTSSRAASAASSKNARKRPPL